MNTPQDFLVILGIEPRRLCPDPFTVPARSPATARRFQLSDLLSLSSRPRFPRAPRGFFLPISRCARSGALQGVEVLSGVECIPWEVAKHAFGTWIRFGYFLTPHHPPCIGNGLCQLEEAYIKSMHVVRKLILEKNVERRHIPDFCNGGKDLQEKGSRDL
jgi:hypothetical protein